VKRLWIRAHALNEVEQIANRLKSFEDNVTLGKAKYAAFPNINDMIVVEITDELAAAVARDAFLMTAGKVLADGEKPPYLGADVKSET
jgi:hypothetical protein